MLSKPRPRFKRACVHVVGVAVWAGRFSSMRDAKKDKLQRIGICPAAPEPYLLDWKPNPSV